MKRKPGEIFMLLLCLKENVCVYSTEVKYLTKVTQKIKQRKQDLKTDHVGLIILQIWHSMLYNVH